MALAKTATALGLLFYAAMLRDCAVATPEEFMALQHHWNWPESIAHCQRGQALFAQFPLLAKTALVVRHHHTPWRELARHSLTADAARLANLVFIADHINALLAAHLVPRAHGLPRADPRCHRTPTRAFVRAGPPRGLFARFKPR